MICTICKGTGSIPGFWLGSLKTCTSCHGAGVRYVDVIVKLEVLEKRVDSLYEAFTQNIENLSKLTTLIIKDIEQINENPRRNI